MLILSRKIGESIVIGGNIVVTLLEQRGGQIRVGIDAARHIKVYRQEVYQQIEEENRAAASSAPQDNLDALSDFFAKSKKDKDEK